MLLNLSDLSKGDRVDFLYPVHGRRNILRRIVGVVDKVGNGPNGPFVTVNSKNVFRSLSATKIVNVNRESVKAGS
jgi:hypothetical protein